MSNGVLIFAHNSREVDYILMSVIAGGLAKKHLKVPVSLVTDQTTLDWAKDSGIYSQFESVFENIILVEKPANTNYRRLSDGSESNTVPFINANRSSAYDLTPYDTTLLIDSDFLIFTDHLNNFWDLDYDVMIGKAMNDIIGDRIGILDKRLSEVGSHMYWATTVMFKKTSVGKMFFDLVSFIRENYSYYGELYRFDSRQYRNDIAFSIAKHVLEGFEENTTMSLPEVTTVLDSDILENVRENSVLEFLVNDKSNTQKYFLTSVKHKDLHIMNKQSIIRHKDKLLKLI